MKLDFRDDTMRSTYWQGDRFEKPTAQFLNQHAKTATHFFDIGSNYGFFSYLLLSQYPHLAVHAFEPNKRTFAHILESRATNQLANLQCWNVGLGSSREKLALHVGAEDSGHSTFGPHPTLSQELLHEIDVLPFDAWAADQDLAWPAKPSWIAKIDVEGFEHRVLQGMSGALRAQAFAAIVIEVNSYTLGLCQSTPEEVQALLESSGYRRLALGSDSGNAFFVPA